VKVAALVDWDGFPLELEMVLELRRLVLLLLEIMELLRLGRLGRAWDIALKMPLALRRFEVAFGCGSGGAMQGDSLYSDQVLTSKKSTGYSSFVRLFMKHLPSKGSSAYEVRMVKLT
jgi:hypothetical protein